MERIKYYFEKYKVYIIIAIIILSIFVLLLTKSTRNSVKASASIVDNVEVKSGEVEEIIEHEKIKIDIKGAVVNPGVYEFDINSRVQDAINEAGGLSQNANVEYINLSKKLKDEMVIIIYTNEFVESYKNNEEQIIYIEYECNCPDNINDACIKTEDILNEVESTVEESEDNLISINTASIEELMTLNGIGESKAKSIIEYRKQNGEFKSIEEIMNVSGIGESAYSKIKDYIKL